MKLYENIEKLLNIGHSIGMPRSTNCKYVLDVWINSEGFSKHGITSFVSNGISKQLHGISVFSVCRFEEVSISLDLSVAYLEFAG